VPGQAKLGQVRSGFERLNQVNSGQEMLVLYR
jgi:hypothetical protein